MGCWSANIACIRWYVLEHVFIITFTHTPSHASSNSLWVSDEVWGGDLPTSPAPSGWLLGCFTTTLCGLCLFSSLYIDVNHDVTVELNQKSKRFLPLYFSISDIDNEGEELCHDANLPPEVDLPVEGTEPQSSPSGMSRHSKLNTSSANEKNFLPLVLILRFGRQES